MKTQIFHRVIFRAVFYYAMFIIIFTATHSMASELTNERMADQSKGRLKPFVATYLITAMGLEGINVTNSLSIDQSKETEQAYHFKSYSMPIGLLAFKKDETRDEQSTGLIKDGKIQPANYTYLQIRNNKARRNVKISFDWQENEVTNHHIHKNSKWSMPIPLQTIDKLSYQLSLMLKLSANPDRHFNFPVADGGKLKKYQFQIIGEERVYTSLGSYKAMKIQHTRYKKDKNITLWCAPELNYLPVKIIQEETGKPTFISTLISYQEGME